MNLEPLVPHLLANKILYPRLASLAHPVSALVERGTVSMSFD